MKHLKQVTFLFLFVTIASCTNKKEEVVDHQSHEEHPTTTQGVKSPKSTAMANIGNTHVNIVYHAPSVRGRVIFGGLVAYNQVWVTGAHSATTIEFHSNVLLNGQKVEKGKYAFFTIPNENEWTVIINKNYEQHLADDYDEQLDVLRLKVKPHTLSEAQEQLLYKVQPTQNGEGIISISWANTMISFNIKEP